MNIELHGKTAYAYTGGKPFDPARPCVALIHGALNDHSVWGLQSRYLAHHGWSVLASICPGTDAAQGRPCPMCRPVPGGWSTGWTPWAPRAPPWSATAWGP